LVSASPKQEQADGIGTFRSAGISAPSAEILSERGKNIIVAPAGAVSGAICRAEKRVTFSYKRRGLLLRDAESAYLQSDDEDARPLDELHGAAIT
jgi:hypothetical protein